MKIYGTIEKTEKQTDGTMIVMGFASSETKDVDGEIIKADAIKAAIPDYMKYANVREMHKADKASGTVLEMEVQADGRTWVKTHIVDAEACKKVEHKVYKGFSIGGRVTDRDADDKTIIKGIKLSEISLVDRPANPDSVFTFAKVDASETAKDGEAVPAKEEAKPVVTGETEKTDDKTVVEPEKKPDAPIEPAKDAADALAGAGADKKDAAAGKTDDVKKGMFGIARFANILDDINYLTTSAEYEAASEGDGSTMPAELKAWLKAGGALLGAMVTEEVAELVAEDEAVIVEVISLSEKAKGLMKAACTTAEAEAFAKGFDILTKRSGDRLAKAGKRNSAADQKHLNAIHDAACAMGATCDATKAAGSTDDLQKRANDLDAITKSLESLEGADTVAKVAQLIDLSETLAKRVTHLEALPKPAKAITKSIGKGDDTPSPEKTDAEKAEDSATGLEAIKKVWRGGGKVE